MQNSECVMTCCNWLHWQETLSQQESCQLKQWKRLAVPEGSQNKATRSVAKDIGYFQSVVSKIWRNYKQWEGFKRETYRSTKENAKLSDQVHLQAQAS